MSEVRWVLVRMEVEDWGVVDAAAYVQSRDLRGFMGTITAEEVHRERLVQSDLLERSLG